MEFAIGERAHRLGQDKKQATRLLKRNPASTPTKKLAVRIDVDHEGDKPPST